MLGLRFEPEAEEELGAAMDWYEEQGPGLGAALLTEVQETLARLQQGTLPGMRIPGVREELGVRRMLLDRFPYSLVFLVHDDAIHVLAFAHHKRVPGYWMDRLEK
ncbi:MAG: hypothetical protein DRJ42_23085 [Deltaproteobacteria bacterium]|nr:MAG: hypothetical protein DRJ42_23085 [Deltaproteobacteria bacterium]